MDVTHTRWSDIGGYEAVKQRLIEAVQWPLQHKDKFAEFGLDAPRGVLLYGSSTSPPPPPSSHSSPPPDSFPLPPPSSRYGPPGCCKTLCAKALSCESGLPFIPVRASELFSKFVGDSEKAVADIFRTLPLPTILYRDCYRLSF